MCWALLAFMISFNLFIPELNSMISSLGGADLKGLNFLLFSFAALISRPISGKLSDTIGRIKVMYIGLFIGLIVTLMYPICGALWIFLLLRFSHGFSAGFLPTGATALVTDLIPVEGRGVAMGIWGTFISVGFGVGNFFSTYITHPIGLTGLFLVAASFAIIAGILMAMLSETLPNPQSFTFSHLKIKMNDVVEPTVLPAAIVMFCSATSTGVVFVTTPDISEYLGIENKGWFFLFYMSSTILIRLFASSWSDRIGRRKVLIFGLGFMVLGMLTVGFAQEWMMYTLGAILFGVSTGISSPTVFAWTADLSPITRRGVGAGTVFMALEAAIIFGAVLTLRFYDNQPSTIPIVYSLAAIMSIVGMLYLFWHMRTQSKSEKLEF